MGKQDTGKLTVQLCRDKVGQSFKIPALQISLSDFLGLKTEDWMFQHSRGVLGDYPGKQQSLVISIVLEDAWSVFPVYSGNIYPSLVSDGVED